MKQHLAISAIGPDRTGLVHDLTRVISDCGGSIGDSRMAALGNEFAVVLLVSAANTGAQMFAVQMNISVPARIHLAHLREEFLDFCDARNLDAILDPVKP
jgi:glycine cleavage system transcriptional repressor